MPKNLTIVREVYSQIPAQDNDQFIDFQEFKRWIKSPRLFRNLFTYDTVRLVNGRIETISKPFITALCLRLICRGCARFEDQNGHTLPITMALLVKLSAGVVKDYIDKPELLRILNSVLGKFHKMIVAGSTRLSVKPGIPVYLRTDLVFGLKPGGRCWITVYNKNSLFFWWSVFFVDWIMHGGFLKETIHNRISRIEYPNDNPDLVIKLYTPEEFKTLFHQFKIARVYVEHLLPIDIRYFGQFIPHSLLKHLARAWGWYVVVEVVK